MEKEKTKMYKEKINKLLRMVLSIRNDLDQIEHSETCKFLEVRRLEQLDEAFNKLIPSSNR